MADDTIATEWQLLHANNPSIGAFAVCHGPKVIWQTDNWDLVPFASDIVWGAESQAPSITVSGVSYERVDSAEDYYLGLAEGSGGWLLISRMEVDKWVVCWAAREAVGDLALVDVAKTATNLIGAI